MCHEKLIREFLLQGIQFLLVNDRQGKKFVVSIFCVVRGLPDQIGTYPSIFQAGKDLESHGQFEQSGAIYDS